MRAIFREREKVFKKYFRRFLFRDAPEFIRCLKGKGYVLALVTGTPALEIQRILPKKLLECFSVVVAGDKIKKGKPYPEPYLAAAKQLGVKPSKCVVIENAPFGITAAKRAGMWCIAITTSLPEEYLKQADMVVDRLSDIAGIIERTCPAQRAG
jgi:beta-phosphoglucomutase